MAWQNEVLAPPETGAGAGNKSLNTTGNKINGNEYTGPAGTNIPAFSESGIRVAQGGAEQSGTNASDTKGKRAVDTAASYAKTVEGYGATPESVYKKFNVTGTSGKARNNLSRLVDALNSRDWGTTAAALGASGTGDIRNQSSNLWVNKDVKEVGTADARAQRQVEGLATQAGQNEISRNDWLIRIGPEMEKMRNTLQVQFADKLDNTQLTAIENALQLFYTEEWQRFSDDQRIRVALRVADVLATVKDDVRGVVLGFALGNIPYLSNVNRDISRIMQQLEQKRINGTITDEELLDLDQLYKNYGSSLRSAVGAAINWGNDMTNGGASQLTTNWSKD